MFTICHIANFCFCAHSMDHSILQNAKLIPGDRLRQIILKYFSTSNNNLKRVQSLNNASIKFTTPKFSIITKSASSFTKCLTEVNLIVNTKSKNNKCENCGQIISYLDDLSSKLKSNTLTGSLMCNCCATSESKMPVIKRELKPNLKMKCCNNQEASLSSKCLKDFSQKKRL